MSSSGRPRAITGNAAVRASSTRDRATCPALAGDKNGHVSSLICTQCSGFDGAQGVHRRRPVPSAVPTMRGSRNTSWTVRSSRPLSKRLASDANQVRDWPCRHQWRSVIVARTVRHKGDQGAPRSSCQNNTSTKSQINSDDREIGTLAIAAKIVLVPGWPRFEISARSSPPHDPRQRASRERSHRCRRPARGCRPGP